MSPQDQTSQAENWRQVQSLSVEQRREFFRRLEEVEGKDVKENVQERQLPRLKPETNEAGEFSLTGTQQAYWIGRSGGYGLGDVSCFSYVEVDCLDLELAALEKALNQMIEHHPMLRAVFSDDGTQRILDLPLLYSIEAEDLSAFSNEDQIDRLAAIRHELNHQILPSQTWPLFRITSTKLSDKSLRLHIGMDALIFDGWSIHLFLTQWGELSRGIRSELPPQTMAFRDYVLWQESLKSHDLYAVDRNYWMARLEGLPSAPKLPLAKEPLTIENARFQRKRRKLGREAWGRVKKAAAGFGVTPTGVLLAAYAEVLALWSEDEQFTINIPRFNRPPVHPGIDDVLGEFASFTLLEIDGRRAGSFGKRAKAIQEQLWRDLDHALFGGLEVLRERAKLVGSPDAATMPVIFTASAQDENGQDAYVTTAARSLGDVQYSLNQTPQVWLDNHVAEQDGELICDWDYVDGLFFADVAEDMLDAFFRLLTALADDRSSWEEDAHATRARLIPRAQIVQRSIINSLTEPITQERLDDLICKTMATSPTRAAILAHDRELNYGELDHLTNLVARELDAQGVLPGDRVGILMAKGWQQPVAVLGILRCRAIFVPVDIDQPLDRTIRLLRDAEVRCVLGAWPLESAVAWPDDMPFHLIEDLIESASDLETPNLENDSAVDSDVACIIYTSGSTGKPKGVMVSHTNIANTILNTNRVHGVGQEDRLIGLTAIHHDLSLYDIFGAFIAGAAYVIPDPELRRDPEHWAELIQNHRVTIWNSVPAMMVMFVEGQSERSQYDVSSLRLVILGGDWVPVDLPDRIWTIAPQTKLMSIGGPTETTIWNIWNPITKSTADLARIPYGMPTANSRYDILDDQLAHRPNWVAGEMVCQGVGVTLGYWRDNKRTAEKYGVHPDNRKVMFRTGDMGRYMPDGRIEILGRRDHQVKINGQRIELGEIESTLNQYEHVDRALARVLTTKVGTRILLAYVKSHGGTLDEEALLAYLADRLPSHMVPDQFMFLDTFPLSRNNKVDRSLLPEPKVEARQSDTPLESSPLFRKLSALVSEVVGFEIADPEAAFTQLGVDSLDLVRLGNRLEREFDRRPRIDELFRLRNLAALTDYYDGESVADNSASVTTGTGNSEIDRIIAKFATIHDPDEKEKFKKSQPGIRKDLTSEAYLELTSSAAEIDDTPKWLARRSSRSFSEDEIEWTQLSDLLMVLRPLKPSGIPKYRYASAGGLYPNQVYLYAKPNRIKGLPGGLYYYEPQLGRLIVLSEEANITSDIHVPFVNSPTADLSAFTLFVVADLSAIAPSYGEHSYRFAALEAGIMAHLLEEEASSCGLGLCQIGSVEFDRIRDLFELKEHHILLHTLLGGLKDDDEEHPWRVDDDDEEGVL